MKARLLVLALGLSFVGVPLWIVWPAEPATDLLTECGPRVERACTAVRCPCRNSLHTHVSGEGTR